MSTLQYRLAFSTTGVDQVRNVAGTLRGLGTGPDLSWLGNFTASARQAILMTQRLQAAMVSLRTAMVAGVGVAIFTAVTSAAKRQTEEVERLRESLQRTRNAYDDIWEANRRAFGKAETKEENDPLIEQLEEQVRKQKRTVAQNPGRTKEEQAEQRQVLFNLERQLEFAKSRNLPTREELRAAEDERIDKDPARVANLRETFDRGLEEEQRKRAFAIQFAQAGEGEEGAQTRIRLLEEKDEDLAMRSRVIEANAGDKNIGAKELEQLQTERIRIEQERTAILGQIFREDQNLARIKEQQAKKAQQDSLKSVIEAIDKEIAATSENKKRAEGLSTEVESGRLTRIGGSIGGVGDAALNYQRRMSEGIARMVGTLDKMLMQLQAGRDAAQAVWGGS